MDRLDRQDALGRGSCLAIAPERTHHYCWGLAGAAPPVDPISISSWCGTTLCHPWSASVRCWPCWWMPLPRWRSSLHPGRTGPAGRSAFYPSTLGRR